MKKIIALVLLLATTSQYGMGRTIADLATKRVMDVGTIITYGVTSINKNWNIVPTGQEAPFALGAIGVTAAFFAAKELVSKAVAIVALTAIVGACAVGKGYITLHHQ